MHDEILFIAATPFMSTDEMLDIQKFIYDKDIRSVAFLDIAPSDEIVDLINKLKEYNISTLTYIDHHKSISHPELNRNISHIRELMSDSEIRFKNREDEKTTTGMVEEGELRYRVDCIIFGLDRRGGDGMLSAFKAFGKPLSYDGIDGDAKKFDSPGTGNNLTTQGIFLKKTINLGPNYFMDPILYSRVKQKFYSNILKWALSDYNLEAIKDYAEEVEIVSREAVSYTREILSKYIKIDSGFIIADITPILLLKRRPDMDLLLYTLFQRCEDQFLVAIKTYGHKSDFSGFKATVQYNIEQPNYRIDVSLPNLLPGINYNIPSRIQVTEDEFILLKKNYTYHMKKMQEFNA